MTEMLTNAELADLILEMIYAMDHDPRFRAAFVVSAEAAGTLRKLKDDEGRYLWSDYPSGEPPRLLGYPVLVIEHMAVVEGPAIAFGDFRTAFAGQKEPRP